MSSPPVFPVQCTPLTSPSRSSVPLLWHGTGVSSDGCAAAGRSASISELVCKCWVTVAALAVTAKRDAWWAVTWLVLRSLWLGEVWLTWEDSCVCGRLLGRAARPPLRFAAFSFNFSSPPWVFGIHDCGLCRFTSYNECVSVILVVNCTWAQLVSNVCRVVL